MSWHYLQEQEEEFSLQNYLDGIRLEQSKSRSTQEVSSSNDNETTSCQSSPSGMMYRRLMASPGEASWMSSVEGSHVKISAAQEPTITSMVNKRELEELNQDYGSIFHELLKKQGFRFSSLKTPLISELRDLSPSSKHLTRWGIMHDGVCWGLGTFIPTMSENVCGYLPTPTVHNAKEGAYPAEYTRNSPTLAARIGGKVNPEWNELRMGWPIGWTALEPLAMDKMQEWLLWHSKHFQQEFFDV